MAKNTELETVDVATGEISVADTVSADAVEATIDRFKNNNVKVMSTLQGNDFDLKIKVASAVASAEPIIEHVGKNLDLQHFILQGVTINDETAKDEAGNPTQLETVRAILLTADGKSYYAISSGIISGLENLVGIVGHPAQWEHPVTVKVEQVRTRKGFTVFNLVPVSSVED